MNVMNDYKVLVLSDINATDAAHSHFSEIGGRHKDNGDIIETAKECKRLAAELFYLQMKEANRMGMNVWVEKNGSFVDKGGDDKHIIR